MPVRPILEIDLNDSKFRRFKELFDSYQDELEKHPELWERIGASMGEAPEALEAGTLRAKDALALAAAQAGLITEALEKATVAQRGLGSETVRTQKGISGLSSALKDAGEALSFVGGWIVRLTAIGGLGALFGGLGFGELASSAMDRLRASGRLGLSTGQLSSFEVNLQQFLPTGAVEQAANTQLDITKAGWLAALGLSFGKAQSESPVALTFQEYEAAARGYRQAQRSGQPFFQTQAGLAANALGLDIGSIRNIAQNPEQFRIAQQQYYQDVQRLTLSRQQAQALADFHKELDRASVAIETDLSNKLGPLAPKLTRLTEGVIDAVAAFVGSKGFDEAVDEVGKGLDWLGSYLGSPKFKTDIQTFGSGIGWIADKLKWLFPHQNDPITRANKAVNDWGKWVHNLSDNSYSWVAGNVSREFKTIMGAIEGKESGIANAVNAYSGASGRFQFEPTTAASYLPGWFRSKYGDSITGRGSGAWSRDEGNVQEQTSKAYYDFLERGAFKLSGQHNNAALIAAGWYGGPGGMEAFFHRAPWIFKTQWEGKHPFPSLYDYVEKVIERITGHSLPSARGSTSPHHAGGAPQRPRQNLNKPIKVTVTNSTSARIAVSLNAVAVV